MPSTKIPTSAIFPSESERLSPTSSGDVQHGRSERSSISLARDIDAESEWSLTSSFRGIVHARSQRTLMPLTEVKDKGTAKTAATFNATTSDGSIQIDAKQLQVLKDFLRSDDRGFQRSQTQGMLLNSNSIENGLGSIFETTFDLTEDRLERLYNLFDGNNNGTITYDDLKLGFAYHGSEFGFDQLDDRTFQALVEYLDADNSGEITFKEFSEGIRLLMLRTILQQLNRSEINKDSVMTQVFDYNIMRFERYLLRGNGQVNQERFSFIADSKSLIDFFLHERGDEVSVRWVNITGEKASNIMKMMALKYRLHPLALEDALEHTGHRPKADSYDGHYFIMVPVFYLRAKEDGETGPVAGMQMKSTWYSRLFRIQRMNASEKNCNSPTDGENSSNNHDSTQNNLIGVHMTSIFITMPTGRTVITFNNEQTQTGCWYKLQDELKKDYSKLRQYDGQYLGYRLLDEAVDQIGEIVKELKILTKKEKKSLVEDNYRNLDRIHSLKQEMYSMSRKFKPFLRLLEHVIEDPSFSAGATIYLRDVLDNLEIHDDDVKVLIANCDSVDAEAEKLQARQMDATLYTLTVFTVTILPAQFLTGVWGMNFERMPELQWQYGYRLFWVLAVCTSVITVSILNCGRDSRSFLSHNA